VLRLCIALIGGEAKQPDGFRFVQLHARCCAVHEAEFVLRIGMAQVSKRLPCPHRCRMLSFVVRGRACIESGVLILRFCEWGGRLPVERWQWVGLLWHVRLLE